MMMMPPVHVQVMPSCSSSSRNLPHHNSNSNSNSKPKSADDSLTTTNSSFHSSTPSAQASFDSTTSKSTLPSTISNFLPRLPPAPKDEPRFDSTQRPKTAPGLPLSTDPYNLPKLSGFSATRSAVRKTPTLTNLSDLDYNNRSNTRRLTVSKEHLLSPTLPQSVSRSTSRSERRSSSARRPPASFSANGIETSFGPPVALITRSSTFTSEVLRPQNPNPAASALVAQQQKSYSSQTYPSRLNSTTTPRSPDWTQQTAQGFFSPQPIAPRTMDSLDAVVQQNRRWNLGATSQLSYGSSEFSPRDPRQQTFRQNSDEGMESSQSSEDLFLKLGTDRMEEPDTSDITARLDNLNFRGRPQAERPSSRHEVQSSHASTRRNSSPPLPAYTQQFSSYGQDPVPTHRRPTGAASVVGVTRSRPSSMTAEQKLNAYRNRYMGTGTPSVVSRASEVTSTSQRRASTSEYLLRQNRPSRLGQQTPVDSGSHLQGSRRSYEQNNKADAAESVSTAQSAVWDEMPELRSHINRADHTRGAGSNGSQDRPRTATTTVTTISSSPKMGMKTGLYVGEGKLAQEAASIHPLLHTSLARCKPVLSANLYRTLEKASSDAVEMAIWSRTSGPNGGIHSSATAMNGVSGDRQLRRKADNLCRNLTELCIALSEGQGQEQPNKRISSSSSYQVPTSRETAIPTHLASEGRFTRHSSLEPESPRLASSRALERVEQRRVSLLGTTPSGSPREVVSQSFPPPTHRPTHLELPNSSPITPSTSLSRTGSSLLRSRRAAATREEEEETRNIRPISRAATEIGTSMRRRSDRFPGVGSGNSTYTSQYPLPQNNILRRVTGGALQTPPQSTSSSVTSTLRSASRFFGDRLAPHQDVTEEDEKKARRRSLGLYPPSSAGSTTTRALGISRAASLTKKRPGVTAGGAD